MTTTEMFECIKEVSSEQVGSSITKEAITLVASTVTAYFIELMKDRKVTEEALKKCCQDAYKDMLYSALRDFARSNSQLLNTKIQEQMESRKEELLAQVAKKAVMSLTIGDIY